MVSAFYDSARGGSTCDDRPRKSLSALQQEGLQVKYLSSFRSAREIPPGLAATVIMKRPRIYSLIHPTKSVPKRLKNEGTQLTTQE